MKKLILAVSLIVFVGQSCTQSSRKEGLSHEEAVKLDQYMVEGQQLYVQYCSNCHQVNGTGLGKLYPPLKGSDFLAENFYKSLCGMKYGFKGELIVNRVTYNQVMPGVPTLTELEIAEISTYIYNKWGGKQGIVPIDTVKKALVACKN